VCNHETGEWVEFQPVNELDAILCGDKPTDMLNAVCNTETNEWNPIGAVHSTDDPICGALPDDMPETAVCDAETGQWQELIVVGTGEGAGCAG